MMDGWIFLDLHVVASVGGVGNCICLFIRYIPCIDGVDGDGRASADGGCVECVL